MSRDRAAERRRLALGAAAAAILGISCAWAFGALAIGRLAVGRTAMGRLKIGELEVGRLTVDQLTIREHLHADGEQAGRPS